jgi:PhnB protein
MSEKTKTADDAEIRAVIEQWAEALRHKDAQGVLSYYAPKVIHFSLAPPLLSTVSTKEGLTNPEGLNSWFATGEGAIGYEIHDPDIMIGESVAFSHSLNRMQGTKTDGGKADIWFRQTFGFHRIDGEWKIVHEHESVPFYMDGSFKAAIDLKP